ncbi:MAG TPA: transketolase family protein [Clostridiales bacterium]|nr:transketolase family protein [Clostridiales bacterium]
MQNTGKTNTMHSQLEASALMLEHLMETDDSIIVMTADLVGSCKLSKIEQRFPERFINVGIAEQNMMSIAAGLAHEGMKLFVHTFSVFATLRACEQMRTDLFYNGANVKVVGTHCGVSTGPAGSTHFSVEDIGVVRAMPKSTVISPSDAPSAAAFIQLLAKTTEPAFIRLDRNPLPDIYDEGYEAVIGKGHILAHGKNIAVIATGSTVTAALEAQKHLNEKGGPKISIVDMPTIKPLDKTLLKQLADDHNVFITVEEHNVYGGLGSAVGQAIAEMGLGVRLHCLGIPDCYPSGNPVEYNRSLLGIDSLGIEATVMKLQ